MKLPNTMTVMLLMASSTLLSGCREINDDLVDAPYDDSKAVFFTTQVDAGTRGTPINNAASLTTMGVFCAATGADDWSAAATSNKMFNEQLNNHSGTWTYQNSDIYWNANSLTDRYTFFAYTPFASADNGITINGSAATQGKPSLRYTVPMDAGKQPDLMVSLPRYNIRPTSSAVALKMKHALTAVGFRIEGNNEKLTEIAVTGVSVSGDLVMDGSTIQWTNLSAPTNNDYSALINFDPGQNYFTVPSTMTNLITGNGYLMMIPQTLGANAKLKLSFADNTVREISLNAYNWTPGAQIIYNISSAGNVIITVEPDDVFLPYTASSSESVTVICKNDEGVNVNKSWTLTVPTSCSWLKLSLNSGGAGATTTLSGSGQTVVYLVTTTNSSPSSSRSTYVYLGPETNGNHVLTVVQARTAAPDNIPIDPRNTCTGAFWRHNQTGERIVKVNVGVAGGFWRAKVSFYDAKWNPTNGDGVVLSKEESLDSGVNTENPGNAENYQITNGVSHVSGSVNNDGFIMFRIGLQRQFSAYDENSNPARYAVVELYYNDYNKVQKIYLRQGEGPDYLMQKNNSSSYGAHPLAAKYTVYNLTAKVLDTQLPLNGATFTEYPSQVGAYFEWGSNDVSRQRYAWNPYEDKVQAWTPKPSANFVAAIHEVAPVGYRRPKEGPDDNVVYPTDNLFGDSEIRQSLCLNEEAGILNKYLRLDNVMCGYYADGFYDRRPVYIDPDPNNTKLVQGVVSRTNRDVACAGRLYFNPDTNASLFFPTGGFRNQTGKKDQMGMYGYFWTSSAAPYNSYMWALMIEYQLYTTFTMVDKKMASTIRCVKE